MLGFQGMPDWGHWGRQAIALQKRCTALYFLADSTHFAIAHLGEKESRGNKTGEMAVKNAFLGRYALFLLLINWEKPIKCSQSGGKLFYPRWGKENPEGL
ncbi:hypothetical protein LKK83_26465 [Phormidium sp. CCY1219]|nr:hypothetical protein [Phormidium sp. CCY1219]